MESLALSIKGLPCVVDRHKGHGECSIVGPVARLVDEVLAKLNMPMLDIWTPNRSQDMRGEVTAEEMRWNLFESKPVSLRYMTRREAMK